MKRGIAVLASTCVLTVVLGFGSACAEGKVTITREENKPKDVEIKTGEEVRFINAAAQAVHVWFGGDAAPRFYVPAGSAGAKVKFDKPGTYEYSVHVTGAKVHSHTGTVVVK